MARVDLREIVIRSRAGVVLPAVDVGVRREADASEVDVYSARTGAGTVTEPKSDSIGRPQGFCEPGELEVFSPTGLFDPFPWNAISGADAAGGFLGKARRETNFSTTTSLPGDDVPELTVTVPISGLYIVELSFVCQGLFSTLAGTAAAIAIYEGSTELAFLNPTSPTANAVVNGCFSVVLDPPTPGDHTYKIKLARSGAATAWLAATATRAAILSVREG